MSATSRIGKGLTALLEENNEFESSTTTEIATELLSPNPWQPRQQFDEDALNELAESIKSQGIIQPLLVRNIDKESYQIIAGERRWRAAKIAGLRTVPVYIRNLTDQDVMASALIENLQREDLNPIEEAEALAKLRETLQLTQDALAAKIGRSRSSVANALRLLQLSKEAQEDVRCGRLTAGHARTLLAVENETELDAIRSYIIKNNLSVRDTEKLIATWKNEGTGPWQEKNSEQSNEIKEKKKKKNIIEKKIEILLNNILHCKTRVRGSEKKGSITITYKSQDELKTILYHMGAKEDKEETL
ncbi:MAG: ParB/RepB/Spo0J family partition protein [Desulfovibrio sp.]|nr:ParB/RepB/Spo0J family partition protein [Desulfovibrio sp.]